MVDTTRYSDYVRLVRERVGHLADEVWNAGRANREMFETLLSAEVEKATHLLGFAKAAEIDQLRTESEELLSDLTAVRAELIILRAEIADLRAEVAAAAPPAPEVAARTTTTGKTAAKKVPARRASTTKAPATTGPGHDGGRQEGSGPEDLGHSGTGRSADRPHPGTGDTDPGGAGGGRRPAHRPGARSRAQRRGRTGNRR